MADVIKVARDELDACFASQAKKLLDISYELRAGEKSGDFLKRLSFLAKFVHSGEALLNCDFHKDHIPCLLVIPDRVIPWLRQLKDVFVGHVDELSRSGECDIEARAFYCPPAWAPTDLYLIFDVDPGDETRGDISNANGRFNRTNRRGLTVEEAIALISYTPDLLTENNLYLLGCGSGPRGKVMSMRAGKGTVLSYVNGIKNHTFGIPSTSTTIF